MIPRDFSTTHLPLSRPRSRHVTFRAGFSPFVEPDLGLFCRSRIPGDVAPCKDAPVATQRWTKAWECSVVNNKHIKQEYSAFRGGRVICYGGNPCKHLGIPCRLLVPGETEVKLPLRALSHSHSVSGGHFYNDFVYSIPLKVYETYNNNMQ